MEPMFAALLGCLALVVFILATSVCLAALRAPAARCVCPHCSESVVQVWNTEGPNFCPKCRRLFFVPLLKTMPPWIWGVVVVLIANWQLMWCR